MEFRRLDMLDVLAVAVQYAYVSCVCPTSSYNCHVKTNSLKIVNGGEGGERVKENNFKSRTRRELYPHTLS